MNARDRLIVALDVPNAEAARALVDALASRVGMFKVGTLEYPGLSRARGAPPGRGEGGCA